MSSDHQQVAASVPVDDPVGLVKHLESNERFHRDGLIGRVFHRGTISFRERVPENSLHIVIVGNEVSVHVDRYAPLTVTRAGIVRYGLWRALMHNIVHCGQALRRLVDGRRGEHRCMLACELVNVADDRVADVLSGSVPPAPEPGAG